MHLVYLVYLAHTFRVICLQTYFSTGPPLTAGACLRLCDGSVLYQPVFQLTSFDVDGVSPGDVVVTDGTGGMVAVLPNNRTHNNNLQLGCIRLLRYKFCVDDTPRPIYINTFEIVSTPRGLLGPACQTIEQYYTACYC